MHYSGVRRGVFVERPNRFIAHAELDGQPVVCHVKTPVAAGSSSLQGCHLSTGERQSKSETRYDLIAVEKGGC